MLLWSNKTFIYYWDNLLLVNLGMVGVDMSRHENRNNLCDSFEGF